MEKLKEFLFGQRSKISSLLIHAIHSDYNTYCTFARRSKITAHEIYSGLNLAGITIAEKINSENMYSEDLKAKALRELFVTIKQDREQILKNITYDCNESTQN